MAVTAHWMAQTNGHLELKCALIAFQRVWGKHTATNLARILLSVFDRAGTTTNVSSLLLFYSLDSVIKLFKTGHVTMDNLETNTKAMEELASLLNAREIPFDAKERRVMCFPHIINIICQHVIAKMSRSALPERDDDDETDSDDNDSRSDNNDSRSDSDSELEDSLLNSNPRQAIYDRDPIARCRKIIVAIRSSGQRRERFESWIKTGKFFFSLHAAITKY
jgi:hypothetical protein